VSTVRRNRLLAGFLVTVALLVLVSYPASARPHVSHSESGTTQSGNGSFSFYKLGLNRRATTITEGPDGALWFAMSGHRSSYIGRMTTSGKLSVFRSTSKQFAPTSITSGSDGAMWFTNAAAGAISNTTCSGRFAIGRITTRGKITFYTDRSLLFPEDIITGPDGALWFLNGECHGGAESLERMTTSGVVTNSFSLTGIAGSIQNIITGPDGEMWFTDYGYQQGNGLVGQSIGRITTSGSITMYPITTGLTVSSEGPVAITAGSDGALWFANQGGSCVPVGHVSVCQTYTSIDRITTSGVMTAYYPPNHVDFGIATGPEAMTAGPGGSVWFANYGFDPSIGRITSSGAITLYPMTGGRGGPSSITMGSDGAIWFANDFGIVKSKRTTEKYSVGRLSPS
jgi:virginiamycin B lyase